MKRKRQQAGYIFQARGNWYVRYFEDRVVDGQLRHDRIAKKIGAVTTRGKRPPRQIEDEAREIVAAAAVTNANPERVLTIGEYVEKVYSPHRTIQAPLYPERLSRHLGKPRPSPLR